MSCPCHLLAAGLLGWCAEQIGHHQSRSRSICPVARGAGFVAQSSHATNVPDARHFAREMCQTSVGAQSSHATTDRGGPWCRPLFGMLVWCAEPCCHHQPSGSKVNAQTVISHCRRSHDEGERRAIWCSKALGASHLGQSSSPPVTLRFSRQCT